MSARTISAKTVTSIARILRRNAGRQDSAAIVAMSLQARLLFASFPFHSRLLLINAFLIKFVC